MARLMREHQIQGIPCIKKYRSKPSGTRPSDVENRLARDFAADDPNTKWVTDITYIRLVGNQWLYLCVVVDLFSGIVVGWSMSRCQNRQLVLQAVSNASIILGSEEGSNQSNGRNHS